MTHQELVQKRKSFVFPEGLLNPSEIENGSYDFGEYLCPWGKWHSNLNAKYLVIGQDWGDENYYTENKGADKNDNPTCLRLKELFEQIGINIGLPQSPEKDAPVYFTNAILGVKQGGMSADVKDSWLKVCATEFLVHLIEIIKPEIIITLGAKAYKAMQYLNKDLPTDLMGDLVLQSPYILNSKIQLYVMGHCGNLGLVNRPFERQKEDWKRMTTGFDLN